MQLEVADKVIMGNGFGYDPIVKPIGSSFAISEMSAVAKNAISHRNKAITAWLVDLN